MALVHSAIVRVATGGLFVTAMIAEGCRARDQTPTQREAAKTASTARPSSCVDSRVFTGRIGRTDAGLELTVDLARCAVLPTLADHAVTLDALAPPMAIVGINGGYFDEHEKPIGLRRIANHDRSPAWSGGKGGVVAFEGSRAYVGPRGLLPFEAASTVQCHPLLVEPGGLSGILSDDGRRAARTTVCDTGDGAIHFVLFFAGAQDGPTLRETAETLRTPRSEGGFGCKTALNLDGGPSTGVFYASAAAGQSVLPRGRIVDALFVVPR